MVKNSGATSRKRKRFMLGIVEVDKVHGHLLAILQNLEDCIDRFAEVPRSEIKNLINQARDFAIQHFREEEDLMVTVGYPMYRFHRSEHDHFFARLDKAMKLADNVTISKKDLKQFFVFLNDWFNSHICVTDYKYAEWIKNSILPRPRKSLNS